MWDCRAKSSCLDPMLVIKRCSRNRSRLFSQSNRSPSRAFMRQCFTKGALMKRQEDEWPQRKRFLFRLSLQPYQTSRGRLWWARASQRISNHRIRNWGKARAGQSSRQRLLLLKKSRALQFWDQQTSSTTPRSLQCHHSTRNRFRLREYSSFPSIHQLRRKTTQGNLLMPQHTTWLLQQPWTWMIQLSQIDSSSRPATKTPIGHL